MTNTNTLGREVKPNEAFRMHEFGERQSWSTIKIVMHSTPGGGDARSIVLSFPRNRKTSAMAMAEYAIMSPTTAAVNVWEYENENDEEMTSQMTYRSPGFAFDPAAVEAAR